MLMRAGAACMHVLRSAYVGAYAARVRPPYTADPFPRGADGAPHRETAVLDLFAALQAREDVWRDGTALHLARAERFGDVFALMQVRARAGVVARVLRGCSRGAGRRTSCGSMAFAMVWSRSPMRRRPAPLGYPSRA